MNGLILRFQSVGSLAKETIRGWSEHHSMRMGAALAYYTMFSIAPLFLLIMAFAGFWFGHEKAQLALFDQLEGLVGKEGGEAIQAMVVNADRPAVGTWSTLVGIGTMAIGATGVFAQLQDVLNEIWGVRVRPGMGLRHFVKDRLLSFAMIISIGFLLLVSLIISAGITAVSKFIDGMVPAQEVVWQTVNFLVSLGLSGVLFALIFKVLPDVELRWRDVWSGALLASILFNIGKLALGFYLGRSTVASAYGAAGSLVVVLIWVYYASQTLFLGAEFTKVYSKKSGFIPKPSRGAEFTQ